jgi:hypothetical protein
MATIKQHIDNIRLLLKEEYNDSDISDQFIYSIFNNASKDLIEKKALKFHKMSDFSKSDFCVEMIRSKAHDCSCAPGCQALRTKYQIPKPISARNRDLINLYTLGYEDIPIMKPSEIRSYKFDPVKQDKLFGFVSNQYIYIYNGNVDLISPKAIIVSSFSSDITEWTKIKMCDSSGNPTNQNCFDIKTSEYPLDEELTRLAYRMVKEDLMLNFQKPKDDTANINNEK